MREKADLREANLNGAILADAKLGGACLDDGFCCATYTARNKQRFHVCAACHYGIRWLEALAGRFLG
jgi:Pentapeptide repeats (8 copies)